MKFSSAHKLFDSRIVGRRMEFWATQILLSVTVNMSSRDLSVGLATDYGLDGPGSIIGSAKHFSSSQHPDRFWGPFSPRMSSWHSA
jgi:hypothetical protein